MTVTIDQIKELRERTGVSMMACKKALEESDGDYETAIEVLRKKGEAKAAERSERSTGEGIVEAYIHGNGKLGVLVQLGCETDFVAKTDGFKELARDIAMHIAAMKPANLNPDDISDEVVGKERDIWREQLKNEGKDESVIDKILVGKEKKYREESSLMTQQYVKDQDMTIGDLVTKSITKLGENIKIVRFSRFSI